MHLIFTLQLFTINNSENVNITKIKYITQIIISLYTMHKLYIFCHNILNNIVLHLLVF